MKICHIVASLEIRHGGPSRSVRRLATAASQVGHEVELLTSAPEAAPVDNGERLRVHTWRRGWPEVVCPVSGMADFLKTASFDAVHHHGLWLRTLHYGRACAARLGVPLVISPRGMMSPWAWRHHRAQKALVARWIHPNAIAAAAGWHATSPEEADEIRRRGITQPVCVAPNGVDRPDSADVDAARAHWRSQVPASDSRRVALFYSRFHQKKRLLELIDLWATLSLPGWLLLVVGVPEQYSLSQLREYVVRAGAAGNVEVYDGADQPPPYAIASLFLLPSQTENFGLVIAEAMAHALPVVVTDTTPWAALNGEDAGWCVPWEKFSNAVEAATGESETRLRDRGSRARDWVLRNYSWENSARLLGEFYATLRRETT